MVALVKPSEDPVRARRVVIGRRVGWASRAGYGALGVAVIAFALAVATDFPTVLVTLTIAGLVAACLVLPVTIIMGYGIRAAERADREQRYG
jgi:anaerobic C4-dicarboxylate transporter